MLFDLTQTLNENVTLPPGSAAPVFRVVRSIGVDRSNVTEFQFSSHTGTHMDAPYHYVPGGLHLDEIPIERFTGSGFVVPVHREPLEAITVRDLLPYEESLQGVSFALLSFGWAQYYGTDEYLRHPYVAEDAAKWLLELGIGCIGSDTLTPDVPLSLRGPGYKGPAHVVLLGGNVLIIENLASMRALEGERVEVYAFPAKIRSSDGAPVRVVARK